MKTINNQRTTLKNVGLFLSLALTVTGCAAGEIGYVSTESVADGVVSNADYGDAPDNIDSQYESEIVASFPTTQASDGARHEDVESLALGIAEAEADWPNTAEEDADDPEDPDGVPNIDQESGFADDDAFDDGLLMIAIGGDGEAVLYFAVSAAEDADGCYYLNVLFDWNGNGVWAGEDENDAAEWAVQNLPVIVTAGGTVTQNTDPFLTGSVAQPVWMRMTLSDLPVTAEEYPDGWDGTGAFAEGETEDYLLDYGIDGDVFYTRTRCWYDNACTSMMGTTLVTKAECKDMGGAGWGPNANDCTAL